MTTGRRLAVVASSWLLAGLAAAAGGAAPGEAETLTRLRDYGATAAETRVFADATPAPDLWSRLEPQLRVAGGTFCVCRSNLSDLEMTKTASVDTAIAGESFRYTLEVANLGPDRADGVRIEDALPAETVLLGLSPGPPACETVGATVTCGLEFLASQQIATVEIDVQLASDATGTVTNTGLVVAQSRDLEAGNDADSADVEVEAPGPGRLLPSSPLLLGKTGDPQLVQLDWSPSCGPGTTDYAVRQGTLGNWFDDDAVVCSTGGALSWQVDLPPGPAYFLIVPLSPTAEGSYGRTSSGAERPASASTPCRPVQTLNACP